MLLEDGKKFLGDRFIHVQFEGYVLNSPRLSEELFFRISQPRLGYFSEKKET